MLSAPVRMHLKSLLGTALWPFPTSLATQCLIGRHQGLVLTFHYIGSPVLRGVGDDLFVPLAEFRRILDFVAARLTPLGPAEFFDRMTAGTLPKRATLLTFDDCLHDTVAHALPEFAKRGLQGCFFACPGLIAADRTVPSLELMWICANARPGIYRVRTAPGGGPPMGVTIGAHESRVAAYRRLWPELLRCPSRAHSALLADMRDDFRLPGALPRRLRLANWSTLANLHEHGMLVGNHTMLHSTVTADGIRQFETEVALAYDLLERRLGRSTRVFCYPYGRRVDQEQGTEGVLQRLETDFAFVTQGGIASPLRGGCLNLHREDASYSVQATKLAPLLAFLR
jgi:peptidoglycan/xylan/chitin deacetylase (PgdA/CDA1 family)